MTEAPTIVAQKPAQCRVVITSAGYTYRLVDYPLRWPNYIN